jgi:Co/Zn/Cd efflux system component
LALLGFTEVARRFFGSGETPHFKTMMIVSVLALIANITSLYLLQRSKSKDVHMKASTICTSNDVIANIGVILAAALVLVSASKIPDLIVGSIVFFLVARGSFKILRLAK